MSKKYKGKICVYCGSAPSETADHVVAREFFLEKDRALLPKVPACLKCNGQKSILEHYLASILPFGGRHADALLNLTSKVPGRLAKNGALHRALAANLTPIWEDNSSGVIYPTGAMPIDGAKLEALFGLIAKGLAWCHWKIIIGPDCSVKVFMLTAPIDLFFAQYALKNAAARVEVTLGTDVFTYRGAQDVDNPAVGVWEMSMYGGLLVTDTAKATASRFGVITGPTRVFQSADRKSRWLSGCGLYC